MMEYFAECGLEIEVNLTNKWRYIKVTKFCAYNFTRYKLSVYMTIGPLVSRYVFAYANCRFSQDVCHILVWFLDASTCKIKMILITVCMPTLTCPRVIY